MTMKLYKYLFHLVLPILVGSTNLVAQHQPISSNTRIDSLNIVIQKFWEEEQNRGIELGWEALELSRMNNYYEGQRESLTNLGNLYYHLGHYDSSLVYHQKSYSLSQEKRDSLGLAKSAVNMGNIYLRQKIYQEGKQVLNQVLDMYFLRVGEPEQLKVRSDALNTLGLISMDELKVKEARRYFDSAIIQLGNSPDSLSKARILGNIGNLYIASADYDSAAIYLIRAIKLYELVGKNYYLAIAYNGLGVAYYQLDRDKEALVFYRKSIMYSQKTRNLKNLVDVYYNLYQYYQYHENYDSVAHYIDKYILIQDSLFSADKRVETLRLERSFSINQERQARELSETKRKYQRNVFLLSLLAVAILSLLITLYLRNRIRLQRINSLRAAEQQRNEHIELLKEQEVESLQSLMDVQESERARIAKDLHDQLGNSLITARLNVEAIKLKQGDLPEGVIAPLSTTQTSIEQALDQVRSISHDMNTGIMAKFGLRRILQDLVKGIDTAGFMKVNLVMDGKSDHVQRDTSILVYRLTQELINNAVKHSDARSLSVQVLSNEFEVTLTVEDDGKGFEPFSGKSDGMGLTNMLTVVEDAGGELSVESSPGNGATFIISLPINNDE